LSNGTARKSDPAPANDRNRTAPQCPQVQQARGLSTSCCCSPTVRADGVEVLFFLPAIGSFRLTG